MSLAILLALAAATPNDAPHPLVGIWNLTYPWHVEVHNGVATPTMETGQLAVEAVGDSLIAVLRRSDPGSRRPTIRFAALATSGDVVFVIRDKVSFTREGSTREAVAIGTWQFTVRGDRLEGSFGRRIEGAASGPGDGPHPLSGQRVRS